MSEGLADIYYQKLIEENESNPGLLLTKFYSELFGLPFSTTNIPLFNKLVKLYGRRLVYTALVETYESGADFTKGFYGLISFVCKKYLEKDRIQRQVTSLEQEVENRLSKKKTAEDSTLTIRSPFDE